MGFGRDRGLKYSFYFKYIFMIIVFIIFCFSIRKIFFVTHDDITYYMYSRLNTIGLSGKELAYGTGRFYSFYSIYLYCLPYIADSYIILKVFGYMSIAFSVFILWRFLKKRFDISFATIAVLLFWGMAQVDYQHNVFIAYILHHQIMPGFIILSYGFLLDYYETGDNKKRIFSAICYAFPLFLYEAFLSYSVLYGIVGFLYICRRDKASNMFGKIIQCIKDLWLHVIFSILFLVCYFGFQILSGGTYAGSAFVLSHVSDIVRTIFSFGMGLFPLRSFIINCGNISVQDLLNNIHITGYIMAIAVSVGVVRMLPQVRRIHKKEWVSLFFISIISIFLPCIPYGFTSKYVDWVNNNGTYGYVPSYFAYFFIIIVLTLLIIFIYQHCTWKRCFQMVVGIVMFLICILTAVNNSKTQNAYAFGTQRYISFDNIVSSQEFLSIDNDSIVYIPDYTGIHGTMWRSEQYLHIYTDKTIKLTKDVNELDFSKDVYEIRYFADCGITAMAKIDEDYCAQEVYILANDVSLGKRRAEYNEYIYELDSKEKDIKLYKQINMNELNIY